MPWQILAPSPTCTTLQKWMMSKRRKVEGWTLRYTDNWAPYVRAYKDCTLGASLSIRSIEIKDPIWVAHLPNGNILSLGPNKSVNPTDFSTLSLFYSTPEAPVKTRNRKGVVVPHEAKHHKYVHSIQTHAIHDLKDIPDQEWAESIHTMWEMVDRDTVQEILTESKRRIDPKTVPPQARLILRECKLLPKVGIQPLYVWIPPNP